MSFLSDLPSRGLGLLAECKPLSSFPRASAATASPSPHDGITTNNEFILVRELRSRSRKEEAEGQKRDAKR